MGDITADRVARFLERINDARGTMEEIVQRMAGSGELKPQTLDDIAAAWDIPYGRLFAWIVADPMREAQYDAALRMLGNKYVLESVGIADDGGGDTQHARLRVDTRLKLAGKFDRARFGEKVDVTVEIVDVVGALSEARARVGRREPVLIEQAQEGGDI